MRWISAKFASWAQMRGSRVIARISTERTMFVRKGGPYGWAMNETSIPDAFLSALSSRDFERLAHCLAPSAQARLLLPRGPQVRSGRDEIARRFEGWFAAGSDFSVLESGHEPVGPRHRLRWRLQMSRNQQAPEIVEQVAFVDVGPEGIGQIDLLCSGFLREAAPTAMCSIDAGPKKVVAG